MSLMHDFFKRLIPATLITVLSLDFSCRNFEIRFKATAVMRNNFVHELILKYE